VLLERLYFLGEEIARVKGIVANELVEAAVQLVGA
jgi:hypothetical protein